MEPFRGKSVAFRFLVDPVTIFLLRMSCTLAFLHHKGFNSKHFPQKFTLEIQTGKGSFFQRNDCKHHKMTSSHGTRVKMKKTIIKFVIIWVCVADFLSLFMTGYATDLSHLFFSIYGRVPSEVHLTKCAISKDLGWMIVHNLFLV
jgi:hypothetical protein